MAIQLTNTLSGKKELFRPIKAGEVRMYACGPTVYGLTHIGNARPAVFFDVVRRYLECAGYKVTYISNYTDVDDKIINRSREEKIPAMELADKYMKAFEEDMKKLGVRPPNEAPRVTQYMPQIIKFIEGLIKNGVAYAVSNGEVFYSVRKFQGYGKLSGKNIDELKVGARVEPNDKKEDPLDFSLWKPQKQDDEPAWDSPWGKGRPGWHIECSVMSIATLGETFDIHGGGIDLIHPHHENEIAQSEGLTGKTFVRYWLHNNMLLMDAEKMSKSLGNIFLTREFMRQYSPETLKFMLLSGHYRSPIDFSDKHLHAMEVALHRVYTTINKCEVLIGDKGQGASDPSPEAAALKEIGNHFTERWKEAMDDDLNTAKAISHVFDYVRTMNAYLDRKGFKHTEITETLLAKFLHNMKSFASIFNLFGSDSGKFLEGLRDRFLKERGITRSEIEKQIGERAAARANKDFKKADAVRAALLKNGIELRDSGKETTWDVVLQASTDT